MDWQRADNIVTTHLGSILVFILVGVTAFVLGSQYKTNIPEVEKEAIEEPISTSSSTISQLQQLISSPETIQTTELSVTQTEQTGLININSATLAQLDTLPGIGPSKAQAIITHRQANGPFVRVDDLINVKGIGPKTLENLRALISI